eukprot:1160435-Pelagomonas_calceolata.AAC.11
MLEQAPDSTPAAAWKQQLLLPLSFTFLQAAANAKHNRGALKTKLVVSECYADKGPYIKRFRPRAKGRYVSRLMMLFVH